MKKKKIKIAIVITLILLIIILAVILFLTGMKKENKKNKTTTTKVTTTTKKVLPITVVDINSKTRPYAVMINNNQAVWGYQAGIQDAYITYEIIVEGGITRLMAVFKDKDTQRIASVRSARHYFLDYALENDAIYGHIGQSPQAQSDIRSLGISDVSADNSKAFTWDNTLRYLATEHRAYTTIGNLKTAAESRGYNLETDKGLLLTYQAEPLELSTYEGAIAANTIKIPYSYTHATKFVYDAENKVYKRFQNEKEHKDFVTGNQYTAKNIITYKVTNYDLNDEPGKGRQGLNNIGSGEGYFISEGYAIPITWEKSSRGEKTIYKVKQTGANLIVNDGNTFIEIQPTNRDLTIE